MKLTEYFESYEGALKANKVSKLIVLLLLISNIILGIALSSKEHTVVMVPPNLEDEVWVSKQDGGMSLKESWASYVATLLGNVTPRSVNQLSPMLQKIIYPGAYKDIMESISALEKEVTTEQLEIQFSPTGVFYVPSRDVVAVSGEFRMRSARGIEKRFVRTYEIGISIRNYAPSVSSIEIYEGAYKPGDVPKNDDTSSKDAPKAKP